MSGGAWVGVGVVIAIALGILAWNIWAIVDCARRPDHQWQIARQEKVLWLVLLILGTLSGFVCGVTMILMPILYMAIPRPALKKVADSGVGPMTPGTLGYGYFPPAVPPGGSPPPPPPSGPPQA